MLSIRNGLSPNQEISEQISNIQYWIIKNDYDFEPSAEVVKSNVLGPLDLESFSSELRSKDIQLTLEKIE